MTITRVTKPRKKGEYLYLRPRNCGRVGSNAQGLQSGSNRSLSGAEVTGANRSLSGAEVTGVTAARSLSGVEVTEVTAAARSLSGAEVTEVTEVKCGAIAYDAIFRATVDKIAADLPQAVAKVSLPNLEVFKARITGQITRNQEIIAQLPELVTQGILDQETANLRTYKLRNEISQLETKLAQLPPGNLVAIAQNVSLPQFWLDLSETERRFYLREFIQKIVINRQGKEWAIELVFIF